MHNSNTMQEEESIHQLRSDWAEDVGRRDRTMFIEISIQIRFSHLHNNAGHLLIVQVGIAIIISVMDYVLTKYWFHQNVFFGHSIFIIWLVLCSTVLSSFDVFIDKNWVPSWKNDNELRGSWKWIKLTPFDKTQRHELALEQEVFIHFFIHFLYGPNNWNNLKKNWLLDKVCWKGMKSETNVK